MIAHGDRKLEDLEHLSLQAVGKWIKLKQSFTSFAQEKQTEKHFAKLCKIMELMRKQRSSYNLINLVSLSS